jgi:hypothetical protein
MSLIPTDWKTYNVSTTGTVVIDSVDHPLSVVVNKEFSWYIVGKVSGGPVTHPAVGYIYQSGPATIKLVRNDGSTEDLPPGSYATVYLKGSQPEGTKVDSRNKYRGAIFPAAGTYTVLLAVGRMTDSEALAGVPYGNVFSLVEKGYPEGFVARYSVPLEISVNEPIVIIPSLIGAAMPVIVPLAAIGINEMKKR